jgi:hypothetical protein
MNELLELFVGCCLVAVSASERLTILTFLSSLRNCTIQHVVPFLENCSILSIYNNTLIYSDALMLFMQSPRVPGA